MKHLKKAEVHIGRKFVKTIVQMFQVMKIVQVYFIQRIAFIIRSYFLTSLFHKSFLLLYTVLSNTNFKTNLFDWKIRP